VNGSRGGHCGRTHTHACTHTRLCNALTKSEATDEKNAYIPSGSAFVITQAVIFGSAIPSWRVAERGKLHDLSRWRQVKKCISTYTHVYIYMYNSIMTTIVLDTSSKKSPRRYLSSTVGIFPTCALRLAVSSARRGSPRLTHARRAQDALRLLGGKDGNREYNHTGLGELGAAFHCCCRALASENTQKILMKEGFERCHLRRPKASSSLWELFFLRSNAS